MLTLTDYIILAINALFFYLGWQKGFLRCFLGPLSLLLSTIACFLYYYIYGNILITLLLGIIGPFVIHVIFLIMINIWHKVTKTERKASKPGRIAGALFEALWNDCWLAMILVLILFIPFQNKTLTSVQENIFQSRSYRLINHITGGRIPNHKEFTHNIKKALSDSQRLSEIGSSGAFQNLLQNKEFRAFTSDPEIQNAIQEKDVMTLLKDERLKQLLEDKEFLKDVFAANEDFFDDMEEKNPSEK